MQVVCGLFYRRENFYKALGEFAWSCRQNAEFWKDAVLYTDAEAGARTKKYHRCFREVVIDTNLPALVAANKMWCCKGWWAKCAADRFDRILYCDFDIYVRKPIDAALEAKLPRGPRFIHIPTYKSQQKVVGCGIAFYERACDWDRYLDLLYNKWHHDEKAWTELLGVTLESFPESDLPMDPYIVHYNFRQKSPADCEEVYLIHGISPDDRGRETLLSVGYDPKEIRFEWTVLDQARLKFQRLVRGLTGRR
jgi:hypothetical protein